MLAIIIVNYKNESKTIEYFNKELTKITSPNIVVIVNNGATEDSNLKLSEGLSGEIVRDINLLTDNKKKIFILHSLENLGFARGNNLGVSFVVKHFSIDFVLFSNNDIRIINEDAVEKLISKIKELPEVGMIGPRVINEHGVSQSPEPYYPFWLRYFVRIWLRPLLPKKYLRKLLKLDYSAKAKEGIHYKIMGCFFIVRLEDFFNCGMMDPNTFLYGEEIILSERMLAKNRYAYYFPPVSIVHEGGNTTSIYKPNKLKRKLQYDSEFYYYKNYKQVSKIALMLGMASAYLYRIIKWNKL